VNEGCHYVYREFRKRGKIRRYFLNKFLLLYGKAKLVIIPPNTKRASGLISAYKWARKHKMGMWRKKN